MLSIAYGEANFENLRRKNRFFIDKTKFIPLIEQVDKFFFIRPRRFGKSLWISVLMDYYDANRKDKFDSLFDGLYIQSNPTEYKSSYLTLHFNFSGIHGNNIAELQKSFDFNVKDSVKEFLVKCSALLPSDILTYFKANFKEMPASLLISFLISELKGTSHKVYVFIDEYDQFINTLVSEGRDEFAKKMITRSGFVRAFYEQLKRGSDLGVFERFFITGVSPIMLDELSSGFNIMSNMTSHPNFNEMLGFTGEEVRGILDKLPDSYYTQKTKEEIFKDLVFYYNGYRFSDEATKTVFNSDMVLYFFQYFGDLGHYPKEILDLNVKTDYGKLRGLILETSGRQALQEIIREINEKTLIDVELIQRFTFEKRFDTNEIKSLLYFFGLLTYQDIDSMVIPNYVIKVLFWEYMRNFLEEEHSIELEVSPLKRALSAMAKEGNPDKLKELAEEFFFTKLSSYDYSNMSEKHIKVLFLSYFTWSKLYNVVSEREIAERKRIDLLFEAHPAYYDYVKYNYIVEFKYIRKTDSAEEAESKRREAIQQATEYYEIYKRDFKQFGRELRSIALIINHAKTVELIKLGGF